MTKDHLTSLMSSVLCPLSSHLELDHFIEAILVRQKVAGLDFNEDFVKRAWEHWKKERIRGQESKDRS
jgi:hypothetical protein